MDLNKNTSFLSIHKTKDEDVLLNWLNGQVRYLLSENETNVTVWMEHLRAYSNASSIYAIGGKIDDYVRRVLEEGSVSRVNHPHIHDLTEVKVSQMTRLKAGVQVKPTHSEYDDRGAAKVANMVISHIFNYNDVDASMIEYHRFKYIFGQIYADINWNWDAGDLDPIYKEARAAGIDDLVLKSGKKVSLDYPIRIGDIIIKPRMPWNFLYERTKTLRYEDARYCFQIDYKDKEELALDYPKFDPNSGGGEDNLNPYISSYQDPESNEIPVFTFWHKKTKYVPKGSKIVFTETQILEKGDHPFSHGEFPVERLTDLDVATIPDGVSRYIFCLPLQKRIDDLNLMIDENIKKFAKTKMLVPPDTNIDQLSDDSEVITVNPGATPPAVLNVNPLPEHLVGRVNYLVQILQTLMGSHGVSRGEIPKGIVSEDALAYLNELESERANSDINKTAKFTINIAKKAISIAGDKYIQNPERLEKIVGKNNQSYIRNFNMSDLFGDYDIQFENSDGFPESIASRRQRINLMFQQNPQMLSGAEWLHYMGLSDDQAVIDSVTSTIQSAESENEDLLNGQPVAPPEDYEDQIVHYRIHVRDIQKRYFKEEATPEIRANYLQHVYYHEVRLLEMAQTSPAIQQQLATLPFFPIFKHNLPVVARSKVQQEAEAQGAANRGTPVPPTSGNLTYKVGEDE